MSALRGMAVTALVALSGCNFQEAYEDYLARAEASTTVPGAPIGVTAARGDGQATVQWTAPADDGGAEITGYTVIASPGGQLVLVGAEARSAVVTGLTNGTAYSFRVVARNEEGDGEPSAPSAPVTPAGVPGAPSEANVVRGDAALTVTWTAAAANGSTITQYEVTISPGGELRQTSETGLTVTGLVNGTEYTFAIRARNEIGLGPSTATAPLAPGRAPSPPLNVRTAPLNGSVLVQWDPPAELGGFPVIEYLVTVAPGALSRTTTSSELVFDGLVNGLLYTFTVEARNTAGLSAPSAESAPTAPAAVVQPQGTVVLNFSVDATARQGFHADGDLQWKGSFVYSDTGRRLTYDAGWAGPTVPLYDDGPWQAGGHEPTGAVAGDHVFGAAVFFAPSPSVDVTFQYGLELDGFWIWQGQNGTLTVPANATGEFTAPGMTLGPAPDTDLMLTMDTDALAPGFTPTPPITVIGTMVAWEADMVARDDGAQGDEVSGDNVYTFLLSATEYGPIERGRPVRFFWRLASQFYGNGSTNTPFAEGLKAYTKSPQDDGFIERAITVDPETSSLVIDVPL